MIEKGSKVTMHYKLSVNNEIVDSTYNQNPFEFVHGSGQVISGIEEHMLGLNKGDKKTFEVLPKDAYGEQNPEAVTTLPKTAFEEADKLVVGSVVQGQQDNQPFQAIVQKITDEDIILDFNHPLAGKTLTFDIEIINIEAA